MKDEEPNKETLDQWSKDPDNWFLGIFYFNRIDKRIFLPKRISQLGWTINFANPFSVLTIIGIISLIIVIKKIVR